MIERIIIVGGPRCGKSKLAKALRELHGFPTFCGDPIDKVKEPEPRVTYLREGMGMDSASSRYIVDHWLPMPGPWVFDGHIAARVARKWLDDREARTDGGVCETEAQEAAAWPCDLIVVFEEQHPDVDTEKGQRSLHKGVMKVWGEIADYFEGMTFTVRWSDPQFEGRTPEDLARLVLGR